MQVVQALVRRSRDGCRGVERKLLDEEVVVVTLVVVGEDKKVVVVRVEAGSSRC